ncbi:MAG: FeoB-associated Cys-rich membrane protein [Desulfobacterales bacterium]|nr:FeoB-associated Cys-rich membrane protein [Desulfobacterales bacterium]
MNLENLIVWAVVAIAIFFTLRSFVKIYKGDGGCNCSCEGGCSTKNPKDQSCCNPNIIK